VTHNGKAMSIALDACIPDGKKEDVEAQIKEQIEEKLWADLGIHFFAKVVGMTYTLALGFVVRLLVN
jgi:hypothetical protein